ncbi:DUF1579 domain-containing protein [Adhaeretor mobilis]|uniref:DUF1579 domain-containing protein n=1 Tax=Adhaeretor mobilis TaxID=1930276 RepID=A0A517N2D5_9BACT|nr:DUF1579 domain-containing protein [Adhaeretor mobilis]QDT01297.1 hypothetical protein HG15A2_46390 [Adhaeretor mobilis]
MNIKGRMLGLVLLSCSVGSTAVAQMATPSAEHKNLAAEVGVWDANLQMWMAPDAPPMPSKGVETNKMMGDFWIISEFKSDMGGMTFTGHGQHGYDPAKKKYVGTWIDSMSPYLSTQEGEFDAKSNTLTLLATGRNMMTGEIEKSKMVSKYIDENTKVFEIYMPVEGEEGKWWKSLQIDYKRRAKSDAKLQ